MQVNYDSEAHHNKRTQSVAHLIFVSIKFYVSFREGLKSICQTDDQQCIFDTPILVSWPINAVIQKHSNNFGDHLIIFPVKFGQNQVSGFRDVKISVESQQRPLRFSHQGVLR